MTCSNMLILLLEAEREELEGKGTSAVAVHVRDCVRCRAVASQLLADTRVLAAHVSARETKARSTRRVPSRPVLWGGALAAAALALFLIPGRHVTVPNAAHSPAVARSNPPASAPASETPASKAPSSALVPMRATRFAEVAAATPVRFAESQTVEQPMPPADSNGVAVVPPAGKRAAVLATRNSKITVVWLY